jgi:hypothetical protein
MVEFPDEWRSDPTGAGHMGLHYLYNEGSGFFFRSGYGTAGTDVSVNRRYYPFSLVIRQINEPTENYNAD